MKQVFVTDYLAPPALLEERELAGLARVDCLLARQPDDLLTRVEQRSEERRVGKEC